MDKNLEQILDYIDGHMTDADAHAFRVEIESNPILKKEYLLQLNLHKALSNAPIVAAPSQLVDNVMVKVNAKKLTLETNTSFSGLKNIGIGALATIIVFSLIAYFSSDQNFQVYTAGTTASYLDYLPDLTFVTEGINHYACYILTMLMIPLLLVMDRIYQARRTSHVLLK